MNRFTPTTMSQSSFLALRDYCGTYFREINLILRENISEKAAFDKRYNELYGDGVTTDLMYNKFKSNITLMDQLFSNSRTETECLVYRKFSSSKIPKLRIGDVYIDKGFISTSMNFESLADVIHDNVDSYDSIANIVIPKNTSCIFIGEMFGRAESELLLNRGLHFKLLSKVNNTYDFRIMELAQ